MITMVCIFGPKFSVYLGPNIHFLAMSQSTAMSVNLFTNIHLYFGPNIQFIIGASRNA